jgi:hypothetical protein
MGTNFYRIPTHAEMLEKKRKLQERIEALDISPGTIERGFCTLENSESEWEYHSPWSEFIEETSIHLGKRSMGWRFCWNFNKEKYYKNKEELLAFIRAGRVVDEYGAEEDIEEFIEMAFSWGEPDGHVYNQAYLDHMKKEGYHRDYSYDHSKYFDLIIDGLRVSTSTEFS